MSAAEPSLYAQLLGPAFARLHPAVQRFHQLQGQHRLHGQVRTTAPASPLARLLAWGLGSPQTDRDGPIHFDLQAGPDCEVWTRHFPDRCMRSTLRLDGAGLTEQLGLARLHFRLAELDGALVMHLQRLHWAGLPCPRRALPEVRAVETGAGNRLHFDVMARLPGIGQVAGYRGYLELPT